MTLPEKIKFHLAPKYGAVVDCYDQAMADSLDDFLTEQRGEEFSVKFEEGKVTFFLPRQTSEDAVERMLQEFIRTYGD